MCRVKRRHDITKTKLQQIGFSDNRVCVHACVPMCAVKNWGWSRLWFEEPQLHTHMGFHWYFARVCKQRLTDVISTHLENVLSLSGHIGQTHPPKHLSQSALIFSLSAFHYPCFRRTFKSLETNIPHKSKTWLLTSEFNMVDVNCLTCHPVYHSLIHLAHLASWTPRNSECFHTSTPHIPYNGMLTESFCIKLDNKP